MHPLFINRREIDNIMARNEKKTHENYKQQSAKHHNETKHEQHEPHKIRCLSHLLQK